MTNNYIYICATPAQSAFIPNLTQAARPTTTNERLPISFYFVDQGY